MKSNSHTFLKQSSTLQCCTQQQQTSTPIPSSHPITMNNSHLCYFHPQNKLTKFCLNKNCTLPLCEKCLPIHLKQHLQQDPSSKQTQIGDTDIVTFEEAHNRALTQLHTGIQAKKRFRKKISKKVEELKQDIIDQVNKKFKEISNQIKADDLEELEEKYIKLKKGSLKSLIYFYSQEQKNNETHSTFKKQIQHMFIQSISSLFSNLSQLTDGCTFNSTIVNQSTFSRVSASQSAHHYHNNERRIKTITAQSSCDLQPSVNATGELKKSAVNSLSDYTSKNQPKSQNQEQQQARKTQQRLQEIRARNTINKSTTTMLATGGTKSLEKGGSTLNILDQSTRKQKASRPRRRLQSCDIAKKNNIETSFPNYNYYEQYSSNKKGHQKEGLHQNQTTTKPKNKQLQLSTTSQQQQSILLDHFKISFRNNHLQEGEGQSGKKSDQKQQNRSQQQSQKILQDLQNIRKKYTTPTKIGNCLATSVFSELDDSQQFSKGNILLNKSKKSNTTKFIAAKPSNISKKQPLNCRSAAKLLITDTLCNSNHKCLNKREAEAEDNIKKSFLISQSPTKTNKSIINQENVNDQDLVIESSYRYRYGAGQNSVFQPNQSSTKKPLSKYVNDDISAHKQQTFHDKSVPEVVMRSSSLSKYQTAINSFYQNRKPDTTDKQQRSSSLVLKQSHRQPRQQYKSILDYSHQQDSKRRLNTISNDAECKNVYKVQKEQTETLKGKVAGEEKVEKEGMQFRQASFRKHYNEESEDKGHASALSKRKRFNYLDKENVILEESRH